MRLFRCDTVDGTYTDAAGKDMYLFVEHKDHGLKMMGNYTFPSLTQTYMAPGGQLHLKMKMVNYTWSIISVLLKPENFMSLVYISCSAQKTDGWLLRHLPQTARR